MSKLNIKGLREDYSSVGRMSNIHPTNVHAVVNALLDEVERLEQERTELLTLILKELENLNDQT